MVEFNDCDDCGVPCYGRRLFCKQCLYKRSVHPQVESRHGYLVDEKLINVLDWLWDMGFSTLNSCQNNHGKIWIEFESDSFYEFMDIVDIKSFKLNKIVRQFEIQKHEDDEDDESIESVSIRFPKKHLGCFERELLKINFI